MDEKDDHESATMDAQVKEPLANKLGTIFDSALYHYDAEQLMSHMSPWL